MGSVAFYFFVLFCFLVSSLTGRVKMLHACALEYYYIIIITDGVSGNKNADCHSYGLTCVIGNKQIMRYCIKCVQLNPNNK